MIHFQSRRLVPDAVIEDVFGFLLGLRHNQQWSSSRTRTILYGRGEEIGKGRMLTPAGGTAPRVQILESRRPDRLAIQGSFRHGQWTYGVDLSPQTSGTLLQERLEIALKWPVRLLKPWLRQSIRHELKTCAMLFGESLAPERPPEIVSGHVRPDAEKEGVLLRLWASGIAQAGRLGHDLAPSPSPTEGLLTKRAACRRCQRTLYARLEGNLLGLAGDALNERCVPNAPG